MFQWHPLALIQSDLHMRTIEAIKTNKRAMIRKCHDKSWLARCFYFFFFFDERKQVE